MSSADATATARSKDVPPRQYTVSSLLTHARTDPIGTLRALLFHPSYASLVSNGVLLAEAGLCLAIIRYIRFTNIDWIAYMQQIDCVLKGERDYIKIRGDTGPLVYPAGHVWIYTALYRLTDSGRDIRTAQLVFAAIYVATLAVVLRLYRHNAKIPPYAYMFLVLSKRLHSLYILRCFNDCIAMAILYASIYAMTRRSWQASAVLFSLALSVKMSILLFAPAFAYLFLLGNGMSIAVIHGVQVLGLQVLLAGPFLRSDWKSYLGRAFELSRAFLFEWTVNWRFLGERLFTTKSLSAGLLIGHCFTLGWAILCWTRPYGGVNRIVKAAVTRPRQPPVAQIPPVYILKVLFTCNLIGMLFARSLHYQFYVWEAHQLVYLAWLTSWHPAIKLLILAAIEVGWETFPSTTFSSLSLLAGHIALLISVLLSSDWASL